MRFLPGVGILCVILAVNFGGSGALGAGNDETSGSITPRSIAVDVSKWTAWAMPLSVCFTRDSSSLNLSDYNTLTRWAIDSLRDTWAMVGGVSFNQSCSSAQNLKITLQSKPDGLWGTCGTGIGATCTINASVADGVDLVKATVIHEVGHALGLLHEHQRIDAMLCSFEQDVLNGCTSCISDSPSCTPLPTCDAADYNACFLRNVTNSQALTTKQCDLARMRIADRTFIPSARRLTAGEDRMSIMNYCSGINGRDLNPPLYDHARFMPTAYDFLGLEMLYPANVKYRVGCTNITNGCFSTGDGAIVRSNGALTSEWVARGAFDVPMRPYGSGNYATTVPSSSLPAGASIFSYQFIAPHQQILTGAGNVTKSNAAHTALVISIFAAML